MGDVLTSLYDQNVQVSFETYILVTQAGTADAKLMLSGAFTSESYDIP
jgi:hypothetical protein